MNPPLPWPLVPLEQLADIGSGVTKGRKLKGAATVTVPYLRVANVQAGEVLTNEVKEINIRPGELERFSLRAGDILMTEGGDPDKLGGGAIWDGSIDPCVHQNHIFRVRLDRQRVSPEYFSRLLAARHTKDYFLRAAKQTTGIATINKTQLKALPIPLPPLAEQKRIAGILDAADALRAKRHESLAQLDAFLQSAFLDMFGDPVTNPMGWEVEVFESWLDNIDSGWSPKCLKRKALKDEWGVLKLGAVTWCEFDETEQKALPPGQAPRPDIEVVAGDLLFARKNTHELVAAAAYVHGTRSKLMLPDLIFRLRLKPGSNVDPKFLWQLLVQPHQRRSIQKLAGGAAGSMPNISKAKLKGVNLIKPPHDLQRRFAAIVESVEQQKASQRAHLEDLDTLFASLQFRAFRGDL